MTILTGPTLKRYFENGKRLDNHAFRSTIDSFLTQEDTTAQGIVSDLAVNQVVVSGVSAGEANFTQSFVASGGNLSGIAKHGASAAVSASAAIGYPVITQQGTVAATATSQIALLPDSANIVGLGLRVFRASSGAGGGTVVNFGNAAAVDYFGAITVSAPGNYRATAVSARRLQNASGAVMAAGVTATANSSFLGAVEYYRIASAPSASAGSPRLVEVTALGSAIGNMDAGGGLAAAFDGVTEQGFGACSQIVSSRSFVGQAWNDAKKVGQFAVFDPNNEGWRSNANVDSLRLYGSNTNNIDTAALLASVAATYVVPTVTVTVQQSEIDTANSYFYHWVAISGGGAGASNYIAEAKFWELVQ